MQRLNSLQFLCLGLVLLSACVTKKNHRTALDQAEKSLAEATICEENLAKANKAVVEQNELIGEFQEQIRFFNIDTATKGRKLRQLDEFNKELGVLYEDLVKQNKVLLNKKSREKEELTLKLAEQERDLINKQDKLNSMEVSLAEREERVAELERLLAQKDSAVNGLQERIKDALVSFDSDDLNVEVRDGKVYVTMSEKLLFKSGSREVDKNGKDALGKIAEVLKKQDDVDILVEGHTDSDKYNASSGPIRNNWDLSVLRASRVIDILVNEYGLSSERVVASGRGEHFPVASNDTDEGKASNRRTEIILSPDLSQIFDILNSKP